MRSLVFAPMNLIGGARITSEASISPLYEGGRFSFSRRLYVDHSNGLTAA